MIEVELPDGSVAEFPDGTPNEVIQRVLAQQFGGPQQPAPAAAAPEIPITDLPAVRASLAPEDQADWSWPDRPNSGLIDYARVIRPELADVPDQQLADAIRQAGYPDMPADEFYRQTGYDERFGYDTSVPNATDGMSGLQRVLAGAGKSFVDTAQGLKQAGTDAAFGLARGMAGGSEFRQALRQQQAPIQQRQTDEATDRRAVDASLMDTGAGLAGNIAGTMAQLLGPGYLARGTGAAAALLPRTAVGNIAQGAALGAVQPVAEGDSRAMNAGLGGLLGGAGYAATAVPGAIARQVGQMSPAISRSMQERAADDVIGQFAADPAAVRAAAANPQTLVPGSMPTLAEASGDMGLAGLQRTLANLPDFAPRLAERQAANNAARVGAIRQALRGADSDAASLIRTQTREAEGPVIADIKRQTGAQGIKVTRWIDRALNSPKFRGNPDVENSLGRIRQLVTEPLDDASRLSAGREVITSALSQEKRMSPQDQRLLLEARRLVYSGQRAGLPAADVAKEVGRLKPASLTAQRMVKDVARTLKTEERGKADVASLYNARKHVTQNLMPTASGEQMIALRGAVQQLDRQIVEVAPSFKTYLADYSAGMRQADQAEIGARLLGGSNAVRAADDNPVLNANFLRRSGDLDQTVRTATGFGRGTAARALSAEQMATIEAVRRDVERQSRTLTDARAVGSNTVQNAIGGNTLQSAAGPVGAAMVEPVSGVAMLAINQLRKTYGEKTMAVVQEVMLDPARADQVLGQLPSRQRRAVMSAIRRLPAVSGAVGRSAVPALTE